MYAYTLCTQRSQLGDAELSYTQSTDRSSLFTLPWILTCRLIHFTVGNACQTDQCLPTFCLLFDHLLPTGQPTVPSPFQCPPFLWTSPVAFTIPSCVDWSWSRAAVAAKLLPFLLSLPLPPVCLSGWCPSFCHPLVVVPGRPS